MTSSKKTKESISKSISISKPIELNIKIIPKIESKKKQKTFDKENNRAKNL